MTTQVYTRSEIEAYNLMARSYLTSDNIHECANRLIELAERIKAERAVVAMEAEK